MDLTLVNNICQIQNRDAADYTHNQKKKKRKPWTFISVVMKQETTLVREGSGSLQPGGSENRWFRMSSGLSSPQRYNLGS